jgi:hypothetical protein
MDLHRPWLPVNFEITREITYIIPIVSSMTMIIIPILYYTIYYILYTIYYILYTIYYILYHTSLTTVYTMIFGLVLSKYATNKSIHTSLGPTNIPSKYDHGRP